MVNKNGFQLMIAGLGGQGALFIGRLLTEAALTKYKNASFLPNYGSQMRLGPSECTVTVSDGVVSSPVTLAPAAAILMGAAALAGFEPRMAPDSLMLVDSTLVQTESKREDVRAVYIPATEIATKLGNMGAANLVLLGAYLEATKALPLETLEAALDKRMAGGKREHLLDLNKAALREGARLMAESSKSGKKKESAGSKKGA